MNSLVSFPELLALVTSGVTLHNGLQLLVAKLTSVANAVASGDVKSLVHDAKGVQDFVQIHDPALAKAVVGEADRLKADAVAEVTRLRRAAAEELRQLAADVEKVAGATAAPALVVPTVPTVPAEPDAPAGA
ncbi:hypothetical protein [Kitasatospora mediocidica]|uniref:hypothetical protein n=1 Tax=Kitasatospora mediocidica TaxID=58352 RepID=UPI00055AA66C|nr:hypothetical protein [Kitasatospora mediocidica]